MIQLTRLNNSPLIVNSDLVKFVEQSPDTVITLVNGEKILVRERDRPVKISKQRAIVKTLMAKTLKGDAPAANTLMNLILRLLDFDMAQEDMDQPLSSVDTEILAVLEGRLLRKSKAADPENGGGI